MKRRGGIGALLPAPPLVTGVLTELSDRDRWHEPMDPRYRPQTRS
jgi:hypothetical protein